MRLKQIFDIVKDRLQGRAEKGQRRQSQWKDVRAEHLRNHPECEVCGRTTKLEVHHIMPFSLFPDLELEPSNLITLCENKKNGVNCHLFFGHLGDYKRFNPNVKADVLEWRIKLDRLDPNNRI